MQQALQTPFAVAAADRAFAKSLRARWRSSLARRLLRRCLECARLAIVDGYAARRAGGSLGLRELPLDAVVGSLEPQRASQFDHDFRPSKAVRKRWLSVWLAEDRGVVLPPISVVQVGDAYAVRDGHHRVSVARAGGAQTITAVVA